MSDALEGDLAPVTAVDHGESDRAVDEVGAVSLSLFLEGEVVLRGGGGKLEDMDEGALGEEVEAEARLAEGVLAFIAAGPFLGADTVAGGAGEEAIAEELPSQGSADDGALKVVIVAVGDVEALGRDADGEVGRLAEGLAKPKAFVGVWRGHWGSPVVSAGPLEESERRDQPSALRRMRPAS